MMPAALAERLAALRQGIAPPAAPPVAPPVAPHGLPPAEPVRGFPVSPYEIEYSGPVFDMVMGSETPLQAYLEEDPDNVVIIVDQPTGAPTRAVGYPRSQLRAAYNDKSAIRYACRNITQGAPAIQDVAIESPMYRVSVPEPYLVRLVDILDLLKSNHRVWLIKRVWNNMVIPYTASRAVIMSDPTTATNLDGGPVNIVGASHCGPDTNVRLMTLDPVEIEESSGGKRRNKKTNKHKKTKKQTKRRRVTRRRT